MRCPLHYEIYMTSPSIVWDPRQNQSIIYTLGQTLQIDWIRNLMRSSFDEEEN